MALPLFSDTYENDERCHDSRWFVWMHCVCGSVSTGRYECVVQCYMVCVAVLLTVSVEV